MWWDTASALFGKDWPILFWKAGPQVAFLHRQQGSSDSCGQELEEYFISYVFNQLGLRAGFLSSLLKVLQGRKNYCFPKSILANTWEESLALWDRVENAEIDLLPLWNYPFLIVQTAF